jgi:hypothetical protein
MQVIKKRHKFDIYKFEIEGKIQAWLVNKSTGISKAVFVDDYKGYKKNLTPNQYLENLAKLGGGESTPTMTFNYVEVSTKYDAPAKDETSLSLGLIRVAPTSNTRVNSKRIIEAQFGEDCFTVYPTIVSASDKKTITLDDVTGLSVGDRFGLETVTNGKPEQRKIVTINSGTNTITLDKDLSVIPDSSMTSYQMISRLILSYGGTGDTDSGYGASIAGLYLPKTADEILYTRHEITYL